MRTMAMAWLAKEWMGLRQQQLVPDDASALIVEQMMFVEAPQAIGVKTGSKPPEDRVGHGLLLFNNATSLAMLEKAFTEGVRLTKDKVDHPPFLEAKREDTRALYTMVVDTFTWPIFEKENTFWHIAQMQYGAALPDTLGTDVVKTMPTAWSEEKSLVVFKADPDWESALDKLQTLRLCIGIFVPKKRRRGRKEAAEKPVVAMEASTN
jgi:hypothetical protein